MKSVPVFHAEIRSRKGILFSGNLASVSSINRMGVFDVLPQHEHFVTMIMKKLILRKPDGKVDEMNVDSGMMVVEEDKMKVFLGVGKV